MLDKSVMVVLPTRISYSFQLNESGNLQRVGKLGQYRMTLSEALQYISDNKEKYMIPGLIMYNISLRDRFREVGAEVLVSELKQIAPADELLIQSLDRFAADAKDEKLGDIDIQMYSVIDEVTVLGHTFHGLQEIADLSEINGTKSLLAPSISKREVPEAKTIHVGSVFERYPCFDSDDYANEDRYYENFVIRNFSITEKELQKVIAAPDSKDYCKIYESMSTSILPIVYYKGEGGFMIVATRR